MDALLSDLQYALRQLRKTPLFACAAIATLAIGIGATTAIFSTVNATLLRPLPYPRAGDLVDVHTRLVDGRVTTGLLSAIEIAALNDSPSVVARAAGLAAQPFDATLIRDDGTPVNALLSGVTEGFFDILELPMSRGRGFTHDEHAASGRDAPMAVVASYRTWTTLFGRDPNVIGKAIRIAEAPVTITVVGVASPALDLPQGTDFWFNFRTTPQDVAHVFGAILRLRPGASIERLRGAAAVAMTGLARTVPSDVGREYVVRSLVSSLVGDLGPTLLIVLGATALLLVLACVNVTNLLLARGMARTREIAVRSALGASRSRVVRQLLTESMVLATAGALAGLLLAFAAVRLLLVLGASKLPRLDAVPFDWRVLLFALVVLLFSGLTMGVAPAWRLASTDIRALLNESGRNTMSSRATSRLMSTMIVAEIALAIALVAGAGWLVQSFTRLRATDPGFAVKGRLVVDVRPTRSFKEPAEGLAWSDEMMSRIRAAVRDARVGSASTFPLRTDHDGILNIELETEAPDPNSVRGGHIRLVTPGFFEAMGIKLLAGRLFTADDRKETQPVVIVNRAFARRYFPSADPLTGAFAWGYPTVDRKTMSRIVGVVQDVRYKSLAEEAEPTFYLPQAQAFPIFRPAVVIATGASNPDALVSSVRDALKRFDPQLILAFTTAPEIVAETLSRQQLGMTLMLIFGATALALAAIGVYGVIAYAAAQRSGEIATRIALGASGRHVFWLMMNAGQRLALAGLLLGLATAYAGGRVVASSVFEMRAADPTVLIAACALVAGMTFAATMIPAIRATRLDPVRALRSE
ncbi:MAG TPA: ADOP family duplicated permease [Vicinamibacterales bacterium]|nr:ADOP family duplicated permease [Vicinamibacterales bacterium]